VVGDWCERKMGNSAEDFTHLWGSFTLKEDESDELAIGESAMAPLISRGEACVVGKLLADRVVGKEVLKTPMIRAWQPSGRVTFKNLGPNLFLIEFQYEWDKSRIMEGRPWTFDGHLLSMVEYNGVKPLQQVNFDRAAFWVRMSNLPLACMSREVGISIGSSVGAVEDVDVADDGVGWGEFLRVRIVLDLSKPLPRGRTIRVRDTPVWVPFKYEKIPKFCFKCGVVRHGDRGCVVSGGRKTSGGWSENEYGPWLRIPSPNRRQGTNRGGAFENKAGRHTREIRGGPGRVALRRFTDDEASPELPDWTDGGQGVIRNGQAKHGLREGSDGGSSEYPAEPAMKGTISRDTSRSLSLNDSENHSAFKENSRMERGGRTYGESVGGGKKVKGAVLEGGDKQGDVSGKDINEGARFSTAEKGKNVYVGQWDAIKAKMVWELADSNPHGWTCTPNGGPTCTPIQASIQELPCITTPLGRKAACETAGDVAECNSIFKFNAPSPEGSRGARATGKKGKKISSCEKGGKGEHVRNKLGKRKNDSHEGETCAPGGKRNKKHEGELELHDELSAGAGDQPRRAT
jgi:hypothetical protein